eukprot:GHVL01025708.1.p1 GENE.GHVL01025708.1~~GHVL01025708.1.p1  ORF type:complete len:649 (-),score=53.68 GHVL01025708.1:519-2465(-)
METNDELEKSSTTTPYLNNYQRYHIAAIWIRKARRGSRKFASHTTIPQLFFYDLKQKLVPFMWLVLIIYMGMAFFEIPSWCIGDDCGDPKNVFRSGLPMMPLFWSDMLECSILILLFFHRHVLKMIIHKKIIVLRNHWGIFRVILIVISVVDIVVASFNTGGIIPGSFRLSRLLRPFIFLATCKDMRASLGTMISTALRASTAFAIMALVIFFWAWIGTIFWGKSRVGGDEEYGNIGKAAWSLYQLITTAGYTGVIRPAYNGTPLGFPFFLTYILANILAQNLMLAEVCDKYKERMKEERMVFYSNRDFSIDSAFDLLKNNEDVITYEIWTEWFVIYSGRSEDISQKISRKIFHELDTSRSNNLTEDEFQTIGKVLADPEVFIIHKSLPPHPWKAAERFIKKGFFGVVKLDDIVDCVLVVSLVITIVQTFQFTMAPTLNDAINCWTTDNPLYWVMFGTTFFFLAEVTFSMFALGMERYLLTTHRRMDASLVILLVIVELAFVIHPGKEEEFIRLLAFLRLARVIRLLFRIKRLRILTYIMFYMVTIFSNIGGMLMVLFWVYATVCIQLFGGDLYLDNPKLIGTSWLEDEFYMSNFNDFWCSICTLFQMMGCNQVEEVEGGVEAVSSNGYLIKLSFIIFIKTNVQLNRI